MIPLIPPPNAEPSVTVTEGPRLLTPQEISTIQPLFDERGVQMPRAADFIGYVKGGKVIGFIVLQQIIHVEPVWLDKGQSQLFLPLINAAKSHILAKVGPTYVYLLAPEGKISTLASRVGMQEEPYKVFSKVINHEVPRPVMDLPQEEDDHTLILEEELNNELRCV